MNNPRFRTGLLYALACLTAAGMAHANSDCSTAQSHADQRKCLEGAASESRARLAQARVLITNRIQAWDEEPVYRQRALTLLKESFLRFERFRDAECEYEAAAAAGGNGAGDMRLQCQIGLNREYTESLHRQLNRYAAPR